MKDINFLVQENEMLKKEASKSGKSVSAEKVVLTVLVITVAIAILFLPGIYVSYLNSQVKAVEDRMQDAKYTEVRRIKAQLQSKTNQTNLKKNIIKSIDKKSTTGTQILLMLNNAMPEDCYYSNIQFNGNQITISGIAANSYIAAELMTNLDRLALLDKTSDSLKVEEAQTEVEFKLNFMVTEGGGK